MVTNVTWLTLQPVFIVGKFSFLKASYQTGLRAFARYVLFLFVFFFSKNPESFSIKILNLAYSLMLVTQNQPLIITIIITLIITLLHVTAATWILFPILPSPPFSLACIGSWKSS